MANWHALLGDTAGNTFSIAYHIPIPSATNRSSINYRTALINSGLGGVTTLKDGDGTAGTISAAEKTSIQSGAILEVVETFATNPGQTQAQLQAAVDARFTALSDVNGAFIAGLKNQLQYYGGTH
jgi:hypothetical protein